MKKRASKYRVLKEFDTKAKAEKYFAQLKDTDGVSIKERKWNDKDKRRYYVRELVRKGCKQ